MDDNSNESPVDEQSEEMEGSSNDSDGLENSFQDQSPESGTDINLSMMGPDQQISSQSVDTLASNQQHQRTSLPPTSASTSEAMDTDQSEEILSRHLGPQDHSYPRQFSENSPKLERADVGSPMADQSTSSTKQITLESDYSPEEENFEITKPITSKRKKEWSESCCEESGTKTESSMSKLQPSKTAITPDCSRSNVRTRENEETECFEGPSLSSSKKRKIEGNIDDQPPLVTHEVLSAVNMDLKATEFLTQSGKSDQSSMEIIETLPPSEPSSRGNNQEVPPQSNQAISSEGVPLTKPSEGDMDVYPPFEERTTFDHQSVAESNNSGYEVSTLIRNAQNLLLPMLKDIMTFYGEEKAWEIIKEKFDEFFHSPCYDKEIELSNALIYYVNQWHKTLWDCASENPEILELESAQKDAYAILINVVATALILTLSEWASCNFDGIALNIKTHRNLNCYFSSLWEFGKTVEIQNEDTRNRVMKLKENMNRILLRMNNVIKLFLMHLGKHASQAIVDKCKKSIRNQDIRYLILKP